MNRKVRLAAVGISAIVALTLAGCTGGAPSSSGNKDLNSIRFLIGQPEDPADLQLTKDDIAKFEKENPKIKVQLDVIPADNVRTVLQTQLRSGDGPDVFGYDTGPGFAGALEKAGLLYDLTASYKKYNWPIYDFAQKRVTFDGKIVGIPDQLESVGLFYNKDLFTKAGITAPTNLADLEAGAKKLKAMGVIPFAVSDKEGWQGGHLLSMALSSEVGSKGIADLIAGTTKWDTAPVSNALGVWDRFNKEGLLTPSPAAITYDNANALFYSGKAAINPTGSWLAQDIERNAKFPVGYIPFPSSTGTGIFSGGLGAGLFISSSTKKSAAALTFLNYQMTAAHGLFEVEKQHSIPAFPVDTSSVTASPLFSQIISDTSKIAAGTGDFGYNIDVLTTDKFNNAMWKGIQGIFTKQTTPSAVATALQKTYQ
ncbi:MAG: extracellular solute-binding protein family 1 [Glaciihabitans sp.]|nr:extracellular solute-binding protein family 1 [Glaciihabitans sp.]